MVIFSGAFAFFGPGEFSTLYATLNRPAVYGRLHFAGEALSTRHAWVVGALDSAWRAVHEILLVTPQWRYKLDEFYKKWGFNEEWIDPKASLDTSRGGEEEVDPKDNMFLKLLLVHCPELFEN